MSLYRMLGAETDEYFTTFYATHPAQPGTYLAHAWRDGSHHKAPILLWGVLADGSPIPITVDGPHDGTTYQPNQFIIHPDGTCVVQDSQSYATADEAAADRGRFDPSQP